MVDLPGEHEEEVGYRTDAKDIRARDASSPEEDGERADHGSDQRVHGCDLLEGRVDFNVAKVDDVADDEGLWGHLRVNQFVHK